MTLNLTRILPTPYFRSYWIQQNITELKPFTAAVSDLYLTPQTFREERVLIPATPDTVIPTTDLAPLLQLLPANSGVYRATAQPRNQPTPKSSTPSTTSSSAAPHRGIATSTSPR